MSVSPIDLLVPLLADAPDLSSLHDETSWQAIREHAGRYGVAALVAYVARAHVPPAERAWCDRILIESWTRHERMLRHLEFVLGLFAERKIPAIALKGPLLAERYYSPAFLRKPSMDLDLAVAEPHLAAACTALIGVGYEQDLPIAEALKWSHHVTLSHPSWPRVELHFRLTHQTMGIPVDRFFERTVSRTLPGGLEARVLGPADQLLHLVLHLAQSRFGTLFHLCEIRRAFNAELPAVRAEAIARLVDHHFCGVLRMTDVAFRSNLREPFIPPDVAIPATWLNWRVNEKLYQAFERWSVPDTELTLAARLRGRWLEFQLTDRPLDALRSLQLFAQTARFQFAHRAWGTTKKLIYVPRSQDVRR